MAHFDTQWVLNRYMHHLLGAEAFEEIKNLLRTLPEGYDGSGHTFFLNRLLTQPDLKLPRETLEMYDRNIVRYEMRLRKARREFRGFRYFQYLALLYAEMYLDQLTADPAGFLSRLNGFLSQLREKESGWRDFPDFQPDDLRRLAFFMATGSGKTLLMHANIWQVLHYLKHGRHPEALVPRTDGRAMFDNIILITPKEGLSAQHLDEFRKSGLDASLMIEEAYASSGGMGFPDVKVIEIHKLADVPSRDGVSVVLDAVEPHNLVIVDEGHKGTWSEAQTWKNRQKRLSEKGFLLEYSATFAQAIGAAPTRKRKELIHEYGKSILFDYSYAHFYGDGYGKDFYVMNLSRGGVRQAYELLVGGLLRYYHQHWLFQRHQNEYRPYHIEKPLWVLLGSSVNAMYTRDKERRSDVAEVVSFLKRFLEEPDWAVEVIRKILKGDSGFQDRASGQDLLAPRVAYLRDLHPEDVYRQVKAELFHGSGGLEVVEIKRADGELGLRLSTAGEPLPYFGVIHIGDVASFKQYLQERVHLVVQEDHFVSSLFEQVNHPQSPIHLLIGAKKFIEGWSSWRVSTMGLLNIGKNEGTQVIQLFGRGVRLKGKGMSLKRSAALDEGPHPRGIQFLETLFIFSWPGKEALCMVVVYTTSSCGWCRLAKQYLDQKGVSYEEVDIAQNPARMAELVFKSSQTSVPVIDVNGTIVVGYNPSALERALQQISQ